MRCKWLVGLLATSGLAGLLAVSVSGSEDRKAEEESAPFAGKVEAVYLKGDSSQGAILQDVRFTRLSGRTFLIGLGADDTHGTWYKGRKVWIPLDDVGEIVELDNTQPLKNLAPTTTLQR